jgi:membrane protein
MWRFLKHYAYELPHKAVVNWVADDAALLAAAVAYYVAISLFPLLLVLISLVGFVLQGTQFGKNVEQQVTAAAANQISPAVGEQLERLLASVRGQASTSGPVGLVLLMAAAIAVFVQFDYAFDRIWRRQPEKTGSVFAAVRNVLVVRLKAFLMLLSVGGLVMAAFVVNLIWTGVDQYAAAWTPFWSQISWWLRQGINVTINIAAFTLIYRFVPKSPPLWRTAFAGAIVAGVGWELGKIVLASFVIGQSYTSAYGVIGSFMAVMLWCYYVVAVVFFGAEYAEAMGSEIRLRQDTPVAPVRGKLGKDAT